MPKHKWTLQMKARLASLKATYDGRRCGLNEHLAKQLGKEFGTTFTVGSIRSMLSTGQVRNHIQMIRQAAKKRDEKPWLGSPRPQCIHLSKRSLLGITGFTAWRVAACSVRIKVWTQEWPPGKRTIKDVTCGNCKRTKMYKRLLAKELEGNVCNKYLAPSFR